MMRTGSATQLQCQDMVSRLREQAVHLRQDKALAESESRFRQLAEGLPQLVWTCRVDGRCDYLGPQWLAYTGLPEAPQLGYGWLEQLHPDDRQATIDRWLAVAPKREPFDIEFRIRRHDGVYRWFRTRALPLRDASGRLVKWFGSNTDIEDLKQAAAAERARYTQNLEREVAARTAELQARNEDLKRFAESVSHDLRAPLQVIYGFANILRQDYAESLDTEGVRLLTVVADNARGLGRMIDDILAFSCAGRQAFDPVSVDMNAMVAEVWQALAEQRGQRAIQFRCGELPPVWGDPAAIRQVWLNLLGNSVKFSRGRQPAVIEVTAAEAAGETVYSISDNGVGFDPAYGHKLFALFQRLHGMEAFEGSGVGLATVKCFVQKLGGRVGAEGRPGEGATFRFALPARRAPS